MALAATPALSVDYTTYTVPQGTSLTLNGGDTATGVNGTALKLERNVTLTLNPGTITIQASGTNGHGIWASSQGAQPLTRTVIDFNSGANTTISLAGDQSNGVFLGAGMPATVTFRSGSTTTINAYLGILGTSNSAAQVNSIVIENGAAVTINSARKVAALNFQGISLSGETTLRVGGELNVNVGAGGSFARGILVSVAYNGPGSTLISDPGSRVAISTSSANSSDGLYVILNARASLQGTTTISTTGDTSAGVYLYLDADQERFLLAPAAGDTASITTSGAEANGITLENGLARVERTQISTTGDQSAGIYILGPNSRMTTGAVTIGTSGAEAHGVVVASGGTLAASDTQITTQAGSAVGLLLRGETSTQVATLSGGSITSAGTAIGVGGGVGQVTLSGATVSGANWLEVRDSGGYAVIAASTQVLYSTDGLLRDGLNNPVQVALPGVAAGFAATATVTATNSTLTGAAITQAGSTSNVTLVESTWNMTGSSNLTNLDNDPSIIIFSPPTGDPTLLASYMTLTTVNYTGDGTIVLNTYLDTDGSPSDRLVIDGGTATGASKLRIVNSGGGGAETVANGILVVDAINGGTTAPGAFSLDGEAAAGPYAYLLYRGSLDGSGPENWYLRSTIDCALFPTHPECNGPDPDPPSYRLETSLYAALPGLALGVGTVTIDTLHERMGEARLMGPASASRNGDTAFGWARVIGAVGSNNGGTLGILEGNLPTMDYSVVGLQGGFDLYGKLSDDGSKDQAGLYVGLAHVTADVWHLDGAKAGQDTVYARSLGAYWTHYGKEGWYVDAIGQATWYGVKNSSEAGFSLDAAGVGLAGSLEAGYPFELGDGWEIEPQGQLVVSAIKLDGGNDGAADIGFGGVNSVAGRIGVRLSRNWVVDSREPDPRLGTGWLRVSLANEFVAKPTTTFSSDDGPVSFTTDLTGPTLKVDGGVDLHLRPHLSVYANAGFDHALNGARNAVEVKLGIKGSW